MGGTRDLLGTQPAQRDLVAFLCHSYGVPGTDEVDVGPTADLSTGTYSGHQGHGDVAWVDYAHVRRMPEEAMGSAR